MRFVDELFAGVVALGAPLMSARFPRAYLDVNREPYELDPRMFDGRLPAFANTRSMRVAGGLGTIPRIVADGQEIYRRRLPVEEALRRIEHALQALSPRAATAAPGHGRALRPCRPDRLPFDAVDRASAATTRQGRHRARRPLRHELRRHLTDLVESALRGRGYAVVRNKPYAGGFITEHYGEPARGRHALQIEINRALYMDERTLDADAGLRRRCRARTSATSSRR